MKFARYLIFAMLACLGSISAARAQTTLTGTIAGISGPINSGTYVRLRLRNFAGFVPYLTGSGSCSSGAVAQTTLPNTTPASNGTFSVAICGNDAITPLNTYYTVEYWVNGLLASSANYTITGPVYNLNTATPMSVPVAPPNDSTVFQYQSLPGTPGDCPVYVGPSSITDSGVQCPSGAVGTAIAQKPQSSDGVCYVSQNGLDVYDGLSWGTAKLTVQGCLNIVPSLGGTVKIGAGIFSFATPQTISGTSSVGKYVQIYGSGSDITTLVYTPVTATTAFTIDCMPSTGSISFGPSCGIHNLTLINNNIHMNGGASSLATGIANGNTYFGAQLGSFTGLKVEGFGVGFSNANASAWGENLVGDTFTHNTIAAQISGPLEKTTFDRVAWLSNGVDLDITVNAEVAVTNSRFNQATVCSINTHSTVASLYLDVDRFENLNISGNVCYIEGGSATVTMTNSLALDDHAVGASSLAWFTAGSFFVSSTTLASGGRITNPNYLFQVGVQGNIEVFISTPGTLDPQYIAFEAPGTCIKVLPTGSVPYERGCAHPNLVAEVSLAAQAANISTTTIYAVGAQEAGLYRVSCYVVVTQAATSSSNLPACDVFWTDADSSASETGQLTNTNAGNVLGGNGLGGGWPSSLPINAKASTNIQYSLGSYASSGATPMQYAVHLRLEWLGP